MNLLPTFYVITGGSSFNAFVDGRASLASAPCADKSAAYRELAAFVMVVFQPSYYRLL